MMTLTKQTTRMKGMKTLESKEVGIDIETYSGKDIDAGVYAYAEDPDFEILLVAYTVDGSEVKCFMPSAFKDEDEQMGLFEDDIEYDGSEDEFIELLRDPAAIKTAYNANFERTCLAKYYGVECPPEEWRCTAVLAATVGLPRSLKDVGEALGLPSDQQKLATGKRLIDYFCKPCKPTKSNGNRCRNMPHHDPAKWKLFVEYNKQDVVSEQAILNKLRKYRPNDTEQALWATDQRINDRGIRIDVPFVEGILENDHRRTEALIEEARELTGLENPNSPTQLKAWFRANGAASLGDTLDKDTIAWALKSDLYPERIKKVLRIRQSLGKISIKKYEAMINSVCEDGRVRGMTRFYGANRTGRWSGQIVQLQNLPQNHIEDLDLARQLVADRDFDTLELLFGDTAQVLSELVRTAFIPADGCKFIVTDFSAIEARVIAWVAGEEWRLKAFKDGGDIYCESASKMFKVPVVKHGVNGHLRQQGKVAELACIAEGQLVDTDQGLIPIEEVTQDMRVWDGEEWVNHGGVIYQGEREVLTYEGLTATPDHLVYVKEISGAVPFGQAAKDGSHLVRSGSGRYDIWLDADHKSREEVEQRLESLLRSGRVHRLWGSQVDILGGSKERKDQGLSKMLAAEADTEVAIQKTDRSQAEMREPERCGLPEVRRSRDSLRVRECDGGGTVSDGSIQGLRPELGDRQDRHQQGLCSRESEDGAEGCQSVQQKDHSTERVRPGILALRGDYHEAEAQRGLDQRSDHRGCETGSKETPEKLEAHSRKVKVYDIRDAGKHHRYTVQGCLVHNCGYGGGVGAIKSMDKGGVIPPEDIPGIISSWRSASPNIVRMWSKYEKAAAYVIENHEKVKVGKVQFRYTGGNLFIKLPSGRSICYYGAKLSDVNGWGKRDIEYHGVNQTTRKWETTKTYGGKLTENVIQAIARDCLAVKLMEAERRGYKVVAHVHDEMIVEAPKDLDMNEVDALMAEPIEWAEGLPLIGGTYECEYYKKD